MNKPRLTLALVLFVLLGAALSNGFVPVPSPTTFPAESPYPRAMTFEPRALACGGSGTNLTAPTWNDVAACHTAAPNAATITVSSGSYTVTTTTTITKFVKIVCAGTCTLTDNVADVADLINITESTAGSTRLEGFTFVSGTGQHSNPNGIVKMVMQTGGKPILITGNTFTLGTTGDAIIAGVNRGVIWNNSVSAQWIDVPGVRCSNNVAFVRHKNTALTAVWTEAPYYGTADTDGQHNLYIETNTLDNVFEGIDVDANGRNVTRYNTIINSGVLNHGADTGTIAGRYIDLYNNTFVWSTTPHCDGGTAPASVDSFIALRGAPALIHSNVIPHISSMAWGSKSEVKFYNEQLRRNAGPYACWNSGYPSPYQVGWGYVPPLVQAGSSGVFQGLEGVYLWSNTGAGNYGSPSLQDYSPNECGGGAPLVSTYIQSGRDFFTATAKPAYTAYPYPHPLTFTDTYYVNKAGNDANSCPTAQSSVDTDAKLTIAGGLSCLSASDTLLVGDGTYAENALSPISGVDGANTILQAENRNAVIVKPPFPNANGYAVPFGFISSYVTIDGVDADCNNWSQSCSPYYWFGAYAHHITVQHGKAHHSRGTRLTPTTVEEASGLDFTKGGGFNLIYDNDVFDNGGNNNGDHAMYIGGTDNIIDGNRITTTNPLGGSADNPPSPGGAVLEIQSTSNIGLIIRNNIMYNNGTDVVEFSQTSNNVQVYNNLIYNNGTFPGRSGIEFYNTGTFTNTSIYFNTIYNSSGFCIGVIQDPGQPTLTGSVIRNNICYQNAGGEIDPVLSGVAQSNNLTTNPSFTNAGAGDFTLLPSSAAIAAGVTIPGITLDITGATRPTPPSIGAYDVTTTPPGALTYYVNKAGNNNNSCTTATSPTDANAKLTVAAGIMCMVGGDTLIIGNGTYNERIRDTVPSGTAGFPTIVKAENANLAILRPNETTIADNWFYVVEISSTRSYITFDGIDADGSLAHGPAYILQADAPAVIHDIIIKNGKAHDAKPSPTDGQGALGVIIGAHANASGHYNNSVLDMEIYNNVSTLIPGSSGYGIYITAGNNLAVGNFIHNNSSYGIVVYNTNGTSASNNVVRNNNIVTSTYTDGILISNGSNNLVYNNIVRSAALVGIRVGYNGSNNQVYFNTVYGNGSNCMAVDNAFGTPTATILRNNICYANASDTINNTGSGTIMSNNLLGPNPLFISAPSNFNLSNPGSPAIAAGVAIPGITLDYAGTVRPNPPSMGAYDVTGSPPATYYVNKAGNDGNSCPTATSSTPANAKLTVVAGAACLTGGSTLIVGNGVYAEALRNAIPSGSSGALTVVKAANAGLVTLRPTSGANVISMTGTTADQYITIDGFITDSITSTGSGVSIVKDVTGAAHHITLQNGKSLNSQLLYGIVIGKPGNGAAHHDNQILNWETYNNAWSGIILNGATTTTIDNVYSHNNGGDGLDIYSPSSENNSNIVRNSRFIANGGTIDSDGASLLVAFGTGNLIYNNIMSGGVRSPARLTFGAHISDSATTTGFYYNTIYAAPDTCVIIQPTAASNILRNNICYQNGTDTISNSGTGTITSNNSLGSNPPFVNAPAQNFHLGFSSPSPVIGQGTAVAGIVSDFDGNVRTNPPDIGALQFVGTSPGTITTVTPSSGVQTATGLNLTLAGASTSWVNGTSVCSFSGTGITVNSTTVSSPGAAVCNVTIASNATPGARNVNMTTNGAVATLTNGFTVLTAPAITSATPNSGVRSQTLNVGLVGSNTGWVQGSSAGSFSGTGVTVNSTTVSSSTAATLNVSVSPTATLGLRNILMTTAGSIATLTNGFTINQVPTKLGYTTQPPASVNSGATLSNVVVAVQFSDGSTSTTSTNSVTISLCSGTGTLTGTLTRNAVAGLATFNNLVVTSTSGGTNYTLCAIASGLTSATSNVFTVVGLGPPTQLTYTTQPPAAVNSGTLIPIVRVAVQFANSTTDVTATNAVTLALCGGSPAGTLSGTLVKNAVSGVVNFNDLSITSLVGGSGYTLCATAVGLTSATSNSFTVNVPVQLPTKLGFTTQPTTVATGATMSAVVVAVQFASGATDTSATNSIVLTLCSGTGTLAGTLTRAAVAGLATFNNLAVTSSVGGANFALCATTSGLTSATSNNFTVTVPPPAPTKVGFTAQPPTTIQSGVAFPSPVRVAIQFSDGSTDTSSTATVSLALCLGSPAGTLAGNLPTNAVAGVATFNNLSVASVSGGVGYSLCATAVTLTSATSNNFNVTIPASMCETNPLVIKNVSWPTGQTGARSLGWNSGGFSIVGVSFTYPGTALFTDTRGCQTTVRK